MSVDFATAPMVGPGFYREDMPLDELQPSPLNPRKHFDRAGLEELAKSIQEVGIIEPLVARPVNGHYELVAGERRFHSAKLAGLTVVPCTVKHLSDSQALEIMVIENNQREDVNALEEADGFSRLLKSGYQLDRLADRLGRSKKYVYDRVKLLDLAAPAKRLLGTGTITAGHAILLARLKPVDQLRALDVEHGGVFEGDRGLEEEEEQALAAEQDARNERRDRRRAKASAGELDEFSARDVAGMKPKSVRETARWIAEHVRFKPHEAAAAAPLEYGEVEQRVLEAQAKPGRGKKVIPITFDHYIQPEARDEHERTFGPRSFKFADGKPHRNYGEYGGAKPTKTCEHSVLGVVAVGEQYGKAFDVCVARDKCQVHWKAEMAERAKNQKLRESGKGQKAERNEQKTREREELRRREAELAEQRQDLVEARAMAQVVDAVTELTPELLRYILAVVAGGDVNHKEFNARFKTRIDWRASRDDFKSLSGRTLVQALVFAAISSQIAWESAEDAFELFKVDLKKIDAAVRAEQDAVVLQTSAQKKPAKPAAKKSAKKKR